MESQEPIKAERGKKSQSERYSRRGMRNFGHKTDLISC